MRGEIKPVSSAGKQSVPRCPSYRNIRKCCCIGLVVERDEKQGSIGCGLHLTAARIKLHLHSKGDRGSKIGGRPQMCQETSPWISAISPIAWPKIRPLIWSLSVRCRAAALTVMEPPPLTVRPPWLIIGRHRRKKPHSLQNTDPL